MSTFLISQLKNEQLTKNNLVFLMNIADENLFNDVVKHILYQKNKDIVLFLIENDKITKSLSLHLFQFIVNNNFLDMFLELDYNKFDIHVDEEYALRWSSHKGRIDIVKFLVENGADIHAKDDFALQWASNNGHIEVVKFLVGKRANIHANQDHALTVSCLYGYIDIVKFLVENGADIHAKSNSPLTWSCQRGHINVVKFLVENGANIHANNDNALHLSSENKCIEVIKFLINLDLEYFSKNEKAIEIVKIHNLCEFYDKFGIIENDIVLPWFLQSTFYINRYIYTQDILSIKKCDKFDFSNSEYYFFFKSLLTNNIVLIQSIFDKIKDKEDLCNTFNKISFIFDDESKKNYNRLFKNIKINEIKKQLEKLKDELENLGSQQ
jgi:hypothetical protein